MAASTSSKRRPRKIPAAAAKRPALRVPAAQLREAYDDAGDDGIEPGQDGLLGDEAMGELDPNLRHRMASETAYRRHGELGYEDGYDLDDWLQAQADIDQVLRNPRR